MNETNALPSDKNRYDIANKAIKSIIPNMKYDQKLWAIFLNHKNKSITTIISMIWNDEPVLETINLERNIKIQLWASNWIWKIFVFREKNHEEWEEITDYQLAKSHFQNLMTQNE